MSSSTILVGPVDPRTLPFESLGQILFNKIAKCSDDVVLIDVKDNKKITYKEIHKLTIKTAICLKNIGIEKGDVISIISRNNWYYVITTIAGFYIGATVNPINPDYSYGELKNACVISKTKLLVCSSEVLENALKLQAELESIQNIILLEGNIENINNFKSLMENIPDSVINSFQPENLNPTKDVALIMLSSGTTGLPKGVALSHANLRVTMLYSIDPEFINFNERETTVAFLPFCHIFGICLFCVCVLSGAKCVIMERFNPKQFLGVIQSYKITKLIVVPPILQFFISNPLVNNYNLSSIKDILVGAAPVGEVLERLVENRFRTCVRQLYGLTELAGAATCVPLKTKRSGSVGKVTTTHKIRFVNEENKEVGPNEYGEIRVLGGGKMLGYLGNPEDSANICDERGYLKTGDLGYYDEHGYIFIVDRIKELIKYKGFQVPPTELENILIKHPRIRDVAVIGKPDAKAGEVPVAFVVKAGEVTEDEVKTYLAERISVQKQLYGGVKFVEQIPKSASGKILRKELKKLLEI